LQKRAYLAWVFVCLVWGTTYLGIRIALETIPPLLMGGIRFATAGAVLVSVLRLRGQRMPRADRLPALMVLGTLLLGFGNGGVVWAEQTVPSGLTAVLVAMSPFWMVGVDSLTAHGEPITLRRAAGLIIGFSGIVLLVWPEIHVDETGRAFLGGVVAAQLACFGWAIGSTYSRRRGHTAARDENVLVTAAFEMLFGGLSLLIAGSLRGELAALTFNVRTALALGYLIVFGAIGGFTAFAYALKHLPIATVSLYAYVNPVIAVALGTIVLKEPFNARLGTAAAIVLTGMALVRDIRTRSGAEGIGAARHEQGRRGLTARADAGRMSGKFPNAKA
jgi:drug/metabolite transporter (DMT)-like permease